MFLGRSFRLEGWLQLGKESRGEISVGIGILCLCLCGQNSQRIALVHVKRIALSLNRDIFFGLGMCYEHLKKMMNCKVLR